MKVLRTVPGAALCAGLAAIVYASTVSPEVGLRAASAFVSGLLLGYSLATRK